MLILSRKSGEAIRVGEATVRIIKRRGQTFRVEIIAPPGVRVLREELVHDGPPAAAGLRRPAAGDRLPETVP